MRGPAGGRRRRHHPPGRQRTDRPPPGPRHRPQADRHRLPGLQPVPALERAGQHHPRAAPGTRCSTQRAEEEARELLSRFGLADKAKEHPDRLSGGQQQRAAIARALATRPELLLFDEITSALDPELVGEVLDVVEDLKQRGLTILMATHEMGFARHVADQVCFLENGVIVEQGSAEEVLTAPREQATQRFLARVLERS
ncbi:amino acid ABC transporter ATP-binding protein [Streptomyces goshikiensis]|uniref:amino acid ABC transporter ATP-binding protein n=1 Tax=Streptomyces goshikiensis TaxID=1942 RepID=UPI0036781D2C